MASRRGRGEGSVFKRRDRPGWVAQLAIGTTPAGRTRYWTRYATTRREAAGLLATAIAQQRRGLDLAWGAKECHQLRSLRWSAFGPLWAHWPSLLSQGAKVIGLA